MNWLEGLKREDLHENYQEMIDLLAPLLDDAQSVQVILTLAGHYNSQAFYFRSVKEIISDRKRRYIIDNFNGDNQPQLSRDTGFSLVYVYEILAEDRNKKQLSFLN
ncbi:MAG: hypothetical protein HZA15_15535 [Nitrospirae bacterium]|nr:hypothetical protein [Nitrospirota bacterium]